MEERELLDYLDKYFQTNSKFFVFELQEYIGEISYILLMNHVHTLEERNVLVSDLVQWTPNSKFRQFRLKAPVEIVNARKQNNT